MFKTCLTTGFSPREFVLLLDGSGTPRLMACRLAAPARRRQQRPTGCSPCLRLQIEASIGGFIEKFALRCSGESASSKQAQARFPDAVQLVYDNYNFLVIGFGPTQRPSHSIFSLAAPRSGVNLCFLQRGAELRDPTSILRGSGKVTRNVALGSADDLDRPDVRALIDAALQLPLGRWTMRKARRRSSALFLPSSDRGAEPQTGHAVAPRQTRQRPLRPGGAGWAASTMCFLSTIPPTSPGARTSSPFLQARRERDVADAPARLTVSSSRSCCLAGRRGRPGAGRCHAATAART